MESTPVGRRRAWSQPVISNPLAVSVPWRGPVGSRSGDAALMFAGLFPRLALFVLLIARPERIDAAFSSWLWPLLGSNFLPFAT